MTRHRLLARQLRRTLGLIDSGAESAFVARLETLATTEEGDVAAAMRGFLALLDQIDQTYELYDRDIALSSRSLEISSNELLEANAVIRAEVEAQARALKPLQEAFQRLAHQAGLPDITGNEPGLAALLQRLGELIVAHDSAQRQLRASEANFRARYQLSPDWYWEQDTDLRFIDTSGRSDHRGGLSPQEHIGRRRWELPHTEPVGCTWDEHRATLAARQSFHDLLLRRRADDGSVHYVEVSGTPNHDADNRFIGYHGIARDVTQRVAADAALREAKLAADAASAAKSQFVANMSHEIRTPLNGLIGIVDLLQDEPLSPKQQSRLRLMRASGQSLLSIINDILDFSRIEAGRLDIEAIAFDLHELIEQLVSLYAVQAQAKSLSLEVSHNLPASCHVVGDPLRLKQVLGNLLSNAVKFTDRGNVRLRIHLAAAQTGGPLLLRFEVEDSGKGIAPAVASTLFQPFTQADAATTRRYGGSGLGLAISKRLVELMGGRIGLESVPGHGALFWVEQAFTVAAAGPGQALDAAAGAHWDGQQVLLVEDNAVNQIVAQAHLMQLGLQVTLATDGLAALQALHEHRFDAVLMDCQMPVMDGYEAVRRWRAIEAGNGGGAMCRTPVIALTANAMTGDRERCMDAGFDDHLGKPFSRGDLTALLRRWVAGGNTL